MALEVVHRSKGNAVAVLDDRAMLVVRSRALTEAAVDAIAITVARVAPRATAERPVGALAIVPGDAGLSSDDLLARQRKIFGDARKHAHVWVAFCVHGDSAQTVVMRAVARMLMLGQKNMTMHARPEAAIVWFATHLGLSPENVSEAVHSLRDP